MYSISNRFAKRDKLGIYSLVETLTLELLSHSISAAFRPALAKRADLENARVKTEIIKNLIRTKKELAIIDEKTYLRLSEQLVEISKMISGWITYIAQKEPS